MHGAIEVRTSFATVEDAEAIARKLVVAKLAACVQIVPGIRSIYSWEGAVRADDEVLALIKTTASAWPELRDKLAELHPYDTPEIIAVKAEHGSYRYLNWIRENVNY